MLVDSEKAKVTEELMVRDALLRAWNLGQTYWQQADSEYTSHNKKAGATRDAFHALVNETCAVIESLSAQIAELKKDAERGHCQTDRDSGHITHLYHSMADTVGVLRFSEAMEAKLHAKRLEGRGGWNHPEACDMEDLWRMLRDHVKKGDPVDIGNFAMMIWNRQNPLGLNAAKESGK